MKSDLLGQGIPDRFPCIRIYSNKGAKENKQWERRNRGTGAKPKVEQGHSSVHFVS